MAEFIFVVLLNDAILSTSLNSKSIENCDRLLGVVIKFSARVTVCVVPLNAVINFGDSLEPKPEVMRSFAPAYASVTVENTLPATVFAS